MSNPIALCFHNEGTLDHRAFTMLGLSAKSSDDAIGFFGTGFKYAIATLLRNGCEVKIIAHDDDVRRTYEFFKKPARFRDKEYEFITCRCTTSDQLVSEIELPYTTHLGAKWQLWQAYRELFTNALDEGGNVSVIHDEDDILATGITVRVSYNTELMQVYDKHDTYFLNRSAVAKSDIMRAIEKVEGSNNSIYYKTMFTGTRVDKQTYFTYDYTITQELTEDRTIRDTWYLGDHIQRIWLRGMTKEQLIEHLPKIADNQYYEHDLHKSYVHPSDAFTEACAYLNEHHKRMPMWAREMYLDTLPFDQQVVSIKLTKFNQKMLARAITVLDHHGYRVDPSTVTVCASLPDNMLGYYKDGRIYIAKQAFDEGFSKLLGTLFEEHLHEAFSVSDMTRKMQNKLIDTCATLMEQVYTIETE